MKKDISFALLTAALALGQALTASAIDITGRVASATDDTALPGTTLKLLSLPDSTFIAGSFADQNGNFKLTTTHLQGKNNQLCIIFSYIGYITTSKNFTLRNTTKPYVMPDVYMQENELVLGEAVVSATPPPLIVREDTVEYYADSYKTQPDAVVEDLLKRLPGLEISSDGSITAQGESVTQIYVDGKEFFGTNATVTIKNLTADMIESVQLVDMKSEESRLTGIDNGERNKVINLKLKPKMRRGWFGNMAGAWGKGKDIDDRFEGKGMVGYFRGNYQNALVANGNNTNNTGFGDLGNDIMGGSSMRGNRLSGGRGDGLNTSWSVGLNANYDEGNRMRSQDTPLSLGGNVLYGGSEQDEMSKTHRINYLSSGNTISDRTNTGNNKSENVQFGLKFEKTFGQEGDDFMHRIQIAPNVTYNKTRTDDDNTSSTHYEDSTLVYEGVEHDRYISQSESHSHMEQDGINYGVRMTYQLTQQTDRGRRRSSLSVNVSGNINDGDHYTHSYTSYDSIQVDDLTLHNDTTINQWQEENNHSESYRFRLTHVEPLAERHFLELSAQANVSNKTSKQLYHFWNDATQQYEDSVNGRSNLDYSSFTKTTNVAYTASVSYRTIQENYNLSIGMDFLPQTQKYTDDYDHSRDYKRTYINYAPRLEYRYNWNKQTNLRVTYSGKTSQPSMNQLQARKNQTSATHVSLGNKNLDPSFSNSLNIRFRKFNAETYSSIEASIKADAEFNNLTSKRWYSENLRVDTTMTVNLAGLGDWSAQGNFRGSFPFYDNLWYVTTSTEGSYKENAGYANIKSTDSFLNHTRTTTGRQQAGIAFRGEYLNVELKGNYQVQYAKATVTTASNLGTTQMFGGSFNAQYTFPWFMTLSSDISYTARRGYSAGINRNQTLWNAQLSQSFLQKKNMTAFIKVFDILQERSSISRNISATSMTDRETTVLGQYFLVGMSIRFNKMGQNNGNGRGGNGGGFGGGRGGNGGGGFGGGRGNNGGKSGFGA